MKLFRILVPAFAAATLGAGCALPQGRRGSLWYEFNPWDVQPTARVVGHGPYKLSYWGHATVVAKDDDEDLYWNEGLRRIVARKTGVPESELDLDYLFWFYHDWKAGGAVKEKKSFAMKWDDDAPGRSVILAEPFQDADRDLWYPLKISYAIFDGDRKKKLAFRYFLDLSRWEKERLGRVVVFLMDFQRRPVRKASGWFAAPEAVDSRTVPGTEVESSRYNWSYRTVRMPDGNRQMWLPAGELIGDLGVPEVGALIVKMLNDMSDEELDALADVEP